MLTQAFGQLHIARVSRRMVAAASVLVVLTLGVFEPLLCLLHCALWQHAMEHRTANTISPALFGSVNFLCSLPDTSATPRHTNVAANTPSGGEANTMASGSAPTPLAQPQPFHEMLLLVVAVLVIISAVRWPRLSALHAPAQRFIAPPHQPPMQAASFFA